MLHFAGRKIEQAYVALFDGDSALDDTDFPLRGDGLGLNFLHKLNKGLSTQIKLKLHEKGVLQTFWRASFGIDMVGCYIPVDDTVFSVLVGSPTLRRSEAR